MSRATPLSPDSESLIDDLVLPFRAEASGVMGRLVRLGPAADRILSSHNYPEPVSDLLGQALCLTSLLGAALKSGSKLILQTKTDGPVGTLVVQNDGPGRLRGYASFTPEAIAAKPGEAMLLGKGHLAMTIDPGGSRDRYQGIVALDHQSLADAALDYFRQSEQLPTFLRLAVGRHYVTEASRGWQWRAGGLMLQHLSPEGGTPEPLHDRLKGDGTGYEPDDNWERTRILAETVEDHELIDPSLAPERLLYRLFHEEGVRAYGAKSVSAHCGCSRERLGRIMSEFDAAELDDMARTTGHIEITCEFCSARYVFARGELGRGNGTE
ncbi:MAG: Hsp33 family molecular chaperone [Hyphomicrobiaceae bacterium]